MLRSMNNASRDILEWVRASRMDGQIDNEPKEWVYSNKTTRPPPHSSRQLHKSEVVELELSQGVVERSNIRNEGEESLLRVGTSGDSRYDIL